MERHGTHPHSQKTFQQRAPAQHVLACRPSAHVAAPSGNGSATRLPDVATIAIRLRSQTHPTHLANVFKTVGNNVADMPNNVASFRLGECAGLHHTEQLIHSTLYCAQRLLASAPTVVHYGALHASGGSSNCCAQGRGSATSSATQDRDRRAPIFSHTVPISLHLNRIASF